MAELYIGLMSGTSLDGVDAVLVDLAAPKVQVLEHCSLAFSEPLKAELLALNTPGDNELHRAALAGNALARSYAAAVHALLQSCGKAQDQIQAIGVHGQTVRHRPQEFDGTGYTLQLNQPALLAELSGIDVVSDFRSRDVAAGGQGAPLVPPFHQAFFSHTGHSPAILNIGGISNLSVLHSDALLGFDCGPGNALLDFWCSLHTGCAFDDAGRWAASGAVNSALLETLQDTPYFEKLPPKSTGRDLFNAPWLRHKLALLPSIPAADVQTTLTELTAWCCAESVHRFAPQSTPLIVCGGGALNLELLRRIQARLPNCRVQTSLQHGLPPLQVEAVAFAWLAQQTLHRKPGNHPSVTGARGARVLGAIYPA
ncbi:MAG: anhydro-N-acetylmuramic acid kinase [Burkholderiales bacterium PBB4]|nr:MAG: anhydro-N-acetylmuramic acid kinase [Burkholderiales bacterium PBB4]